LNIGVSTACFYPELTETAVFWLGNAGVKNIEIFFNTHSEFDLSYIKELKTIIDEFGMNVISAHPFLSGYEHYLLFSNYDRRIRETVDYYEYTFERCAELGIKIFSFHGDKIKPMYILSALFAFAACGLGLFASYLFNLPTGASVIVISSIIFFISMLAAKK